MKLYKCFLFMLILLCSFINISGNNSSIGIGESSNDSKRALEEQIDNYIILQFNQDVKYAGGKFLNHPNLDYNKYISYIMNGNETIDRNTEFTVNKNTKLEVHFNQTFTYLQNFLDFDEDQRFASLISAYFCHFDTSSVTNMNFMFSKCSSLQTLYLSNLNTSSVTGMTWMFAGCTSLKYLIISNFDCTKAGNSISDIFKNVNNLEYIDIYNIKYPNSADFENAIGVLNNKVNLIVCQNNKIINNPNAIYKCCNIIDDILVCNNIQTTIPLIQTTIPQIQTTIPQIQSTIPQIQTTIPQIQSKIRQLKSTIPRIKSTIPQIQSTIPQIQSTIPQIQTNIPIIQTTIPQINIPEIMNEQTSLTLLGFNHFKLSSSSISFNILFTQILNEIYSNLMKVPLIIIYNENISLLEEKEIECYLKEKNITNIVSFFCETEIKNSNIKNVKIIPKFNFINQTNITIIGLTPFARMYINNLQDIDDKYDNLENNIVHILDHSIYNKYSTYIYNITGIMNQKPKSKLEGKNINLMINLKSEDEISTESSCTIIKKNENSYTLNCESRKNIDGDLQVAISFINEEEILLINFEGRNNSTITINTPYKKYFLRKSSKGLKSGEIVAIILSIVFVLAAVIGLIMYFKKKKNTDNNESSIKTESKAYLNLNKI